MHMVATAAAIDDRPSAFRYPRGEGIGLDLPARGEVLPIGKGRIIREGTKVALLELRHAHARKSSRPPTSSAPRASRPPSPMRASCKPLDEELVRRLAREHEVLITIEEGAIGGFATHVMHDLTHAGLLESGLKFRPMTMPDIFIDHDAPPEAV